MSSPADVITQLLQDLSLGVAFNTTPWPVFTAYLPDKPDQALCVYGTAGMEDGRLMGTGEKIIHKGIQIRVRGIPMDYAATYAKAEAIALALDAVIRSSVAISSDEVYIVHNISRKGDIMPAGADGEGTSPRYHFTINATVTVSSE